MSDKDKHAAAHKPAEPAPFKAKIPHEQEVQEGVKAAESHRQTTRDVAEAEHAPFKAPPPPPLMAEMTKLMDEVAEVSKKHKKEVLDLRTKFHALQLKIPFDPNGPSMDSLHSAATRIEEGLNMLDPDCSARAPG